jgi:hypothetical protein
MKLRLESIAFKRIHVRMVRPIAPQQNDLFTRLGPPSEAGRKAIADDRALAGEEDKLMPPVFTHHSEVPPQMLPILPLATGRVLHPLRHAKQIIYLGVGEGKEGHAWAPAPIVPQASRT